MELAVRNGIQTYLMNLGLRLQGKCFQMSPSEESQSEVKHMTCSCNIYVRDKLSQNAKKL